MKYVLVSLMATACLVLAGCGSSPDYGERIPHPESRPHRSDRAFITYGSPMDDQVENGKAYLSGIISDLKGVERIYLPSKAKVVESNKDFISFDGAASLRFVGHPGAWMSYRSLWDKAVLAVRVGENLVFIDNVSWDSHMEGGADLQLVFQIPGNLSKAVTTEPPPVDLVDLMIFPDPERRLDASGNGR